MSTDPQRPIEKLLRDSAQTRREQAGAPFELHLATRRLLQGEVARQFSVGKPVPESGGLWQTLRRFWPRIAWSLGSLVVVALSAWLLFPSATKSEKETLLAKSESVTQRRPAEVAPGPAARATAAAPDMDRKKQLAAQDTPQTPAAMQRQVAQAQPGVLLADSEKAKAPMKGEPTSSARPADAGALLTNADEKDSSNLFAYSSSRAGVVSVNEAGAAASVTSRSAPVAVAGTAAEPNAPTTSLNAPAVAAAQKPDFRMDLAAQPPVPSSTVSSESQPSRLADKVAQLETSVTNALQPNEITQNFRRLDTVSTDQLGFRDDRSSVGTVLSSFQVKQAGDQVQIVDHDGSVYIGHVLPSGNLLNSALVPQKAPTEARSRALVTPPDSSSASVAGVNQESLQRLAFQVTGTNVSLKQRVVFTGNLIWTSPTNTTFGGLVKSSGVAGRATGGVGGGGATPTTAFDSVFSSESRISGKLTVGDGREVDLEAVPTKP